MNQQLPLEIKLCFSEHYNEHDITLYVSEHAIGIILFVSDFVNEIMIDSTSKAHLRMPVRIQRNTNRHTSGLEFHKDRGTSLGDHLTTEGDVLSQCYYRSFCVQPSHQTQPE
ncbi:hypothetical protein PILCRDRAFT_639608 [Piloderma croceum F 1598]|uniref:Uncharacterized protein n=1 Tax=Piloderma croceum (strain F 1598) TaxID=765440 RepID=A0A0C3F9Y3_PILCF|nr:hypothetical protein PILCRDRAFT_639608 [Piloderma croceum F 1598]